MARCGESPAFACKFCGLVDAPRRESAGFAGAVKEDDVAGRIAQASFAPHPRLVARAMFERETGLGQPLELLVEIVAFEIDGSGRRNLLVRIDLDRQRRSAGGFEAGIIGRVVDDLSEAQSLVES